GGVLAMYPQRGVHTVLVTCTNGEMGDSPDGLKPESDAHDTVATSELRLRELREAVKALGVNDLELLGYRDSGMMGWPQNKEPEAFWNLPVEEAVDRVAALMEKHRPEVVITYDDRGLYGHPDHIQAHRATIGAAKKTGIPQKIYEIAFPKSLMDVFAEFQRQQGEEPPAPADNENAIGTPDELITTHVDVSSVYDQKRAAALAHQSQMANFDFLKIDEDMLRAWFSMEHYVRRFDRTGAPVPEDDLFAGVS
ncbi:MAG: PIG-L family deacetylase, partial [Candidatus Dormiibacterota bacterium]